jgi:hypothetical protein
LTWGWVGAGGADPPLKTWGGANRPPGAPALLLLLPAIARAQDPPPPPPGGDGDEEPAEPAPVEPTEEMLAICPELKTATGHAREQLVALFFGLDVRDLDDEEVRGHVRELFDLGKPEDVALLGRYLDAPGPCRCMDGLKAIVVAHGAEGLSWVLERLAAAEPAKKGRLVALVGASTSRESWRVLRALLSDTTSVPNHEQAQIAPPGYEALRVADHAFVALGTRIADLPRPEGIAEWRVDPVMPVHVRDSRIAALRQALATDAVKQRVGDAPSLLEGLPAPQAERLRAALKAAGGGE